MTGGIGLYLLALRLGGVTTLNPQLVLFIFFAALAGIIAINLFSLGATFNYLVALFHKKPVRQGLFGKPIFTPPLDRQFGWFGLIAISAGVILGGSAFGQSWNGWEIERLWLYLLAASLLIVIGIQLTISWLVMRIMEELAHRGDSVQRDLVEEVPLDVIEATAVRIAAES